MCSAVAAAAIATDAAADPVALMLAHLVLQVKTQAYSRLSQRMNSDILYDAGVKIFFIIPTLLCFRFGSVFVFFFNLLFILFILFILSLPRSHLLFP